MNWIRDTIAVSLDSNTVPVFLLKDLFDMYKYNLKQYGASASSDLIQNAHRTRFKDQLLNLIPGLVSAYSPKRVTLTLDGEVGKALFRACLHSAIDDNTIIRDAARRIR